MKRLITLIFSAALLCPMFVGAQTKTTPSNHGPLHYSGTIVVDDFYPTSPYQNSDPCTRITDLYLNIQSPNNASPMKVLSGMLFCGSASTASLGFSLLHGVLVATSGNRANTTNDLTTGYIGKFTLGRYQGICTFPPSLESVSCKFKEYFIGGGPIPVDSGGGVLTYTGAP